MAVSVLAAASLRLRRPRVPTAHGRWARLACDAPVAVFAAVGVGGWGPVQELRGVSAVRLVPTPRHATVLLLAGAVPNAQLEALHRVHDQLPHPRATVAWRPAGAAAGIPAARSVDGSVDAVVAAMHEVSASVIADPSTSTDDLLPDVDPNEWRGIGPFGQGGEGMMGGTPYGRPMAMTGDDRDGLALDQLHLTLGPFLDALPAGLLLDVTLQGDVLQRVTPRVDGVVAQAVPTDPLLPLHASLAGARRGLRWLAHALHVEGLDALAVRAARLAGRVTADADRALLAREMARVARRVRRTGVLFTLRGVGTIADDAAAPNGSWPSVPIAGDVATRWRGRMDAIHDALHADADRPELEPTSFDAAHDVLSHVLPGMTVRNAVSTIVSLDIDCSGTQTTVAR